MGFVVGFRYLGESFSFLIDECSIGPPRPTWDTCCVRERVWAYSVFAIGFFDEWMLRIPPPQSS